MKSRIFYICLLLFLFTVNNFAQSKPDWLINLEKTISQKENRWKIDNKVNKVERFSENDFDYNLVLKSGQTPLAIQITRMNNLPNIEETFAGQQIAFGNIAGKNAVKIKLKDIGDECYLWRGNRGSSAMLNFRKDDYFVTIFTKSEVTAKRFARYILEQMPKN